MIRQILFVVLLFTAKNILAQKNIVVQFENIANGKKIVLNDSVYTNTFDEKYTVSKLKYYVSNISLMLDRKFYYQKKVNLVDVSKKDSIVLSGAFTHIWKINFTIGVDSILNCSGAQAGALDPLNDMFWTWNSGYVNFKLEGKSENSTAVNKKIEQHIGGYKTPYKTMQTISLALPQDYFKTNNTITIQMDLDKYWSSNNSIQIANNPVTASPGELAAKASANFTKMFSLKNEN
jgi:hypothetical protein